MLNVTKSFLPPIEEYMAQIKRSFDNAWLTNRGELVEELEEKLASYLDIPYLTLTANGTLPLQIALKALNLTGEIITTPFSYIATTNVILWQNLSPVFVDIEPKYFTIDPEKIEAAITEKTSAILATHVFGNPCDVKAIEKIAAKYNLKVIYDGAHAFGVKYKGKSLFEWGDVSTCSFHATKLMHTGEGGMFYSPAYELQKKLFFHHNFGHNGQYHFEEAGINAKMSELHAAMGLAVFPYLEQIISHRKAVVENYRNLLQDSSLQFLKIRPGTEWNYHYFPVIFESEKNLLQAVEKLNNHQIFPRRYYYPSLNTLPFVSYQKMEVSEDFAKRILCLPLSAEIRFETIQSIMDIIFA
ncbi:MAG: DegT/DnrJ/EryC1/StrS family aminotransferase [Flavobacteriaceae bacterium]|nr:DegT/DnrJ/EryC1/StrS family aminotransferase [Flavobacteriaceae bacterium]